MLESVFQRAINMAIDEQFLNPECLETGMCSMLVNSDDTLHFKTLEQSDRIVRAYALQKQIAQDWTSFKLQGILPE